MIIRWFSAGKSSVARSVAARRPGCVVLAAAAGAAAAAGRPRAGTGGRYRVWAGISAGCGRAGADTALLLLARARRVGVSTFVQTSGARGYLRLGPRQQLRYRVGTDMIYDSRGHAALRARRLRGRRGPRIHPGRGQPLAAGPAAALRPKPGQRHPHRPVAGPPGLPAPPAGRLAHRFADADAPHGAGRPGHRPPQRPRRCRPGLWASTRRRCTS